MSLLWTILATIAIAAFGTGFCYWLMHKTQEVQSSLWILEHIVCPMLNILVLLILVSLVYPLVDTGIDSLEFWEMLSQQGRTTDLLNILFFVGLLLAFIPIVGHPVFFLPLQSILTIALIFNWQHAEVANSLQLLPSLITFLKVFFYMLLAWLVTRESSIYLSRWLDHKFSIEGSIRLIADAIYLVLQIPVMLIYSSFLKLQLGG